MILLKIQPQHDQRDDPKKHDPNDTCSPGTLREFSDSRIAKEAYDAATRSAWNPRLSDVGFFLWLSFA